MVGLVLRCLSIVFTFVDAPMFDVTAARRVIVVGASQLPTP